MECPSPLYSWISVQLVLNQINHTLWYLSGIPSKNTVNTYLEISQGLFSYGGFLKNLSKIPSNQGFFKGKFFKESQQIHHKFPNKSISKSFQGFPQKFYSEIAVDFFQGFITTSTRNCSKNFEQKRFRKFRRASEILPTILSEIRPELFSKFIWECVQQFLQ